MVNIACEFERLVLITWCKILNYCLSILKYVSVVE